jgi:hypothetical protein
MTLRHALPFVILAALCGCDRLGKGIGPQPKMPRLTQPASPAAPPAVEPPIEEAEVEPPAEEALSNKAAESTPAPTDPLVLYEDSFADVAGSIRRKIDGKPQPSEGPPGARTVYTFQAMPEDGMLTLRIFEDNQTAGPDGKPGVLAFAWDEIPQKLAWSGFVYLGGATAEKRMVLPKLKGARTADDLRGLRLKFSYRGINASGTPVQLPLNCRLEPVLEESFKHRIDFGVITARDEWQAFDVALADGTNQEAFLKIVAEANPPAFKIVFGQSRPITEYHAGDTLQLDDISFTSVAPPVGK